ncbi:MAG: hypothetical protein LBF81_00950 [Prevotellaceae bacterium]|jgi:hypothetical protein|nr:hypothetical protein [Prevotellaceae bacterium]
MQGDAKQQVQDVADFSTPLRSARNDGAAGVIASEAKQSRRIGNWLAQEKSK